MLIEKYSPCNDMLGNLAVNQVRVFLLPHKNGYSKSNQVLSPFLSF